MAAKLDITPLSEWGFFTLPKPCVIAGPCSAETEEQLMETARQLHERGIHVLRAGIWKPRTHPGCFEGIGSEGLKWMQKAKKEYGLRICTEVASEKHVYECIKHGIDMVWIGARTTTNPFLVQEIAEALRDTDIPVLVKNPANPDIDLWIGALERLNREGIKKLGIIHRGFSSFEEKRYRNSPHWEVAVELKSRYPELAFFCDPSHMAGCKEYIPELSQKAMNIGFDGLMVESHNNPACALSDAKQQYTPKELLDMLYSLTVRNPDSDDIKFQESIEQLRTRIDSIDEELIRTLSARMMISRKIGQIKKESNVAIVQTSRWESILEKVLTSADIYGLDRSFISSIFNSIHDASVQEQNKILSE